jgi:hypothetical protein
MKRRDWLSAALVSPAVTFSHIRTAEQDPLPQPESLSGTVRLLTQVLSERDVPADPEPIEKQVVLVVASGEIFPLI